jgi:hypothetical protein
MSDWFMIKIIKNFLNIEKVSIVITFLLIFLFIIPTKAGAWRFAVLGDTRPGNSYNHSQNNFAISTKIPNSERVTVLNSGDLTLDGTVSQLNNFMSIVSPLSINWSINNPPEYIPAVGNHDTHDANWISNWTNFFPSLRYLLGLG